jgi:hypothetical protein
VPSDRHGSFKSVFLVGDFMADLKELQDEAETSYEAFSHPLVAWNPNVERKAGKLAKKAVYAPTLYHALEFCRVTRDNNPAHQRDERYGGQAISPGLLQTAVEFSAAKDLVYEMDRVGNYRFTESKAAMRAVMPTGFHYDLEIIAERVSENCIATDTRFRDADERAVCRIQRKFYTEKPAGSLLIDLSQTVPEKFVHRSKFQLEQGYHMGEFSKLIGLSTQSPQRNSLAFGASSSVICSAVNGGVLPLPSDLRALYVAQNMQIDTGLKPSLHDGIDLELYLSDRAKFGVKDSGWVRTSIVGKKNGETVYMTQCDLSFSEKDALDRMFDSALVHNARK